MANTPLITTLLATPQQGHSGANTDALGRYRQPKERSIRLQVWSCRSRWYLGITTRRNICCE